MDTNEYIRLKEIIIHTIKGGQGSGNFGHAGRIGLVGGSSAGDTIAGSDFTKVGTLKRLWGDETKQNVYKANDTKDLMNKSGSVVVAIRGNNKGEVLFTSGHDMHNDIIRAVHPNENEDNYVRFSNRDGAIVARVIYAGIPITDFSDQKLINSAIDNIYKASNTLNNLGLSKDTPMIIYTVDNNFNQIPIKTTIKEFYNRDGNQ